MSHQPGLDWPDPAAAPSDPPSEVSRRNAKPVVLGLIAGVAAGAVIASGAFVALPLFSKPACTERSPLRVVATPEVRTVVAGAVDVLQNQEDGDCPLAVTISAERPEVTAANLVAERGDRPDVWIPDSSVWTRRATKPGTGVPADNPSVAITPVVLATSRAGTSSGTTVAQLVPPAGHVGLRWVLPDPEDSAATVGALVELQDAVAGRTDGPARFGSVVRTSQRKPVALSDLPRGTAVPTTEQQAYSHNHAHPDDRVDVAYAPLGFRFDYPMVVLTAERERRDRAGAILEVLRSDLGQQLLANAGFRGTDGTAGGALIEEFGPAARTGRVAALADAPSVNSAIRAYTSIVRPTRLLAAIDVSGSMAHPVPGARGATRLDLAVQAAVNGLAVYSDDTVVGVWEFATNLTPTTDYKVMAPLQQLGVGRNGQTGRQRIAQALSKIRPTSGRTGLNDTTLAAVREVRRHWDPKRVNSVVIITDGGNSDKTGISTADLLRTLAAEHDPERPVTVFAIAYGPTSDFASLQRISAVTGGRAYAAPDPRQIGAVLADAIGRRSCTPDC